MQLYPHLTFNGECEKAFQFYENTVGGKIALLMKYRDVPSFERPPGWDDKVLHATFALGDCRFSGADVTPEQYQIPCGFAMQLNLSDAAQADRIFQRLAEQGSIQMPLQETFWAQRFGMLVDRFGTPWIINCEKTA